MIFLYCSRSFVTDSLISSAEQIINQIIDKFAENSTFNKICLDDRKINSCLGGKGGDRFFGFEGHPNLSEKRE